MAHLLVALFQVCYYLQQVHLFGVEGVKNVFQLQDLFLEDPQFLVFLLNHPLLFLYLVYEMLVITFETIHQLLVL